MAASTVFQGSVLAFDIADYSKRTPQAQKRAQQLCARVLAEATKDPRISILAEHWLDAGDGGYLIMQGDVRGALYAAENFARLLAEENADLADGAQVDIRYAMGIGTVERWTDERGTRTAGDVINDTARLLGGMDRAHKGQAVASGRYRDALVNQAGVDPALFSRLKDIVDKHGGGHAVWNVRRLPGFGVEQAWDEVFDRAEPLEPTPGSHAATGRPITVGGRDDFEHWLQGRPSTWGRLLAARSALRALAFGRGRVKAKRRVDAFRVWLFRSNSIAWFAGNFSNHEMASASASAAVAFNAAAFAAADDAAYAAAAAAADAATFNGAAWNAGSFAEAAVDAAAATAAALAAVGAGASASWRAIFFDCELLQSAPGSAAESACALAAQPLWPSGIPPVFSEAWAKLRTELLAADPSWTVWIDWYERRIAGEQCGFNLPPMQDIAVQLQFAAADAAFWDRPAPAINADIAGWIDAAGRDGEAMPSQDKAAITYGVNPAGLIDRRSYAEQAQLRDEPDQREAYADVRDKAIEMAEDHGQRLGKALQSRLDRLIASMPEAFESALARPIWRDFEYLESILDKHNLAAKPPEFDPDRLAPPCAIDLNLLVKFTRVFRFGDDSLRAKDEQARGGDDRIAAAAEAAAAMPVIAAIIAAPEVATEVALDDLRADADLPTDPADGSRDAGQLAEANRTRRNWIAAWLGGAKSLVANRSEKTADDISRGIGQETGRRLVQLVVDNRDALIAYVGKAFPTYDLAAIIEKIIAAAHKFWL